jgi:ADP-L-glycero-D-manno-heptose 6-epimerase
MFVITGACGFIGSNMISYLNKIGINNIIAIDDFGQILSANVNTSNLQNLKLNKVYPISVREIDVLPDCEIMGVFHFGAISNTLEKNQQKIDYFNVKYTEILGDVCKKRNIPLIFSSTAAIYGNGNGPLNPYAESKLAGEKSLSEHSVCLRLFNVYGKNESHKGRMSSVIFKWFHELKTNKQINLFENSDKYKRDFVFVDDVCDVFYKFLNNYKPGVYDFGSGEARTFENIADIVIKQYGFGNKNYIPMPEDLINQYQKNTIADLSLINKIGIEINPTIPEIGISKYINYLKNMET